MKNTQHKPRFMVHTTIVGLIFVIGLAFGAFGAANASDINTEATITGCIKAGLKVAVKCNGDGTFTLTLNGTPTAPVDVTMTSQTPGVIVTPPQQTWTGSASWTLTGATPGQTVTLFANATQPGGGGANGSDLCCSGEIKIVMPDCPPPVPPYDLALSKIGEVNPANTASPYNFTIGVINLGAGITNPTTLTFTDVVPAGMTFNSYTNSNWNCGPIPALSGATVTCTYTGTFPIATNQPLGWVNFMATGGSGPYTNCASLGQPDSDPTNDKACDTVQQGLGNLIVGKEIINKTDPQISTSGLVFPVTVTCGSTVTNLNLINGLAQTVDNIPFNTSCSVVEGTLPTPSGACPTPPGGVPTWTTAYVPPTPVTVMSGITPTIRVQNTLECKPAGLGTLIVVKEAHSVTDHPLPAGLTYPVNVTCGAPTNQNWSLVLTDGVPQTVSTNIGLGSVCTGTEIMPLPVPAGVCDQGVTAAWQPPQYVVTTSGTTTTITVRNLLVCLDGPTGALSVTKTVSPDPRGIGSTLIFPMTLTCTNPSHVYPLNVHGNTSTVPINLLVGSHCSILETPPPPSPPPGCTWLPPVYSPATVTIAVGMNAVTVTNSYVCRGGPPICPPGTVLHGKECVPSIVCGRPLVPNATGTECVCGHGLVLRRGKGVEPVVCRPPLVLNATGTDCVCRSGLVLRRGKCVEPVVCRSPADSIAAAPAVLSAAAW